MSVATEREMDSTVVYPSDGASECVPQDLEEEVDEFSITVERLRATAVGIRDQQKIDFRHTVTHCGVSFDLFKSILQNSIRRGDLDAIAWFVGEVTLLRSSPETTFGTGKCKITNIINTLEVITMEDVSARYPACANLVFANLASWRSKGANDVVSIASACFALALTPKSRVCSHLRIVHDPRSSLKREWYIPNENPLERRNMPVILKKIEDLMKNRRPCAISRVALCFLLGDYYKTALGVTDSCIMGGDERKNNRTADKKKNSALQFFWRTLEKLVRRYPLPYQRAVIINVQNKKQVFEEKDAFQKEFICILSAAETTYAYLHRVLAIDNCYLYPQLPEALLVFMSKGHPAELMPDFQDNNAFRATLAHVTNEDTLWKLEEVEKNYVKVRSMPPTAAEPAKRKNTDNTRDDEGKKDTDEFTLSSSPSSTSSGSVTGSFAASVDDASLSLCTFGGSVVAAGSTGAVSAVNTWGKHMAKSEQIKLWINRYDDAGGYYVEREKTVDIYNFFSHKSSNRETNTGDLAHEVKSATCSY